MNNEFVIWWHNIKKYGRLKFIEKIILSMILTITGVVLICLLLTGNIDKILKIESIKVLFIGELITSLLGLLFGNLLWNKYDRIYHEKIESNKYDE